MAPCKGIRIRESGKFLLVESGILTFWNREFISRTRESRSRLQSKIQVSLTKNLESRVHVVWSRIQDRRGFPYGVWFFLGGGGGRRGAGWGAPTTRSNVWACAKNCVGIATFDLEKLHTCGYVVLRARTGKFSLYFKKVHWRWIGRIRGTYNMKCKYE